MALTPKDRDKFFKELRLPDLLFQHLVSKAAYAVQDHSIVWGRLNTVFTGWLALVGGCIWLHSAVLGSWTIMAWLVAVPLLVCDVLMVLTIVKLLRAAHPAHQSDAHSVEGLRTAWQNSRENYRKDPSASTEDQHMELVERTLLLANWRDVAEDSSIQNRERHANVNVAFKLVVASVGFFVAAVVLWFAVSAFHTRGNTMAIDDPRDPQIEHPPTELTTGDDPQIEHPPTELIEKGEPDTSKK